MLITCSMMLIENICFMFGHNLEPDGRYGSMFFLQLTVKLCYRGWDQLKKGQEKT